MSCLNAIPQLIIHMFNCGRNMVRSNNLRLLGTTSVQGTPWTWRGRSTCLFKGIRGEIASKSVKTIVKLIACSVVVNASTWRGYERNEIIGSCVHVEVCRPNGERSKTLRWMRTFSHGPSIAIKCKWLKTVWHAKSNVN